MSRCNDTLWLSLRSHGDATDLLTTERVQDVLDCIPNPSCQQPSLFVLIGNREKTTALRELFGIKRTRHLRAQRSSGDIHLHVDPSSIFQHPLLIADGDVSELPSEGANVNAETTRRTIRRPREEFGFGGPLCGIYAELLSPFANVFCFFCDDMGGLESVAHYLIAWSKHRQLSTEPGSTHPRIIIVTDRIPVGIVSERITRRKLRRLIGRETKRNVLDHISAIEVIALFPTGSMSAEARYRPLKERLMTCCDQVREQKQNLQRLFSATHFAAFLESACQHFSDSSGKPFDFVKSSRAYNPVATELKRHLSSFLAHIKCPNDLTTFAAPVIASSFFLDSHPPSAHYFPPDEVFDKLYKNAVTDAIESRLVESEELNEISFRSGFVDTVKILFQQYTEQAIHESLLPSDIHLNLLRRYQSKWLQIHSNTVCLSCLRHRGPPHTLPCGHMICSNCVRMFCKSSEDDPFMFLLSQCLLCQVAFTENLCIRMHPPTAGVGVFCIDGGGVRGIMPLQIIKQIKDCIDLPIAFQRFIKVAFGVSSGGLIVADMFINGSSPEESMAKFEELSKGIFQRRWRSFRTSLGLMMPILPSTYHVANRLFQIVDSVASFFNDGLYSSEHIERALKKVCGVSRSVLDISNATATGTLVGLPVATTDSEPTCRIFTNFNGAQELTSQQDKTMITPEEGSQKVPLWEIARAVSAAPGFFPPKHISNVGTFQDSGPLENDPLVSALSALLTFFPHVEKPDFIMSLGTGEPKSKYQFSTRNLRNVWKNGALPRLYRLFREKMRDKKVRQAFEADPRYHRLDVQYDGEEPRLDDIYSIPEMRRKVMEDEVLSHKIRDMARCLLTSLFYFELESLPRRINGKYVGRGYVLCSIRRCDPAFVPLFDRLSRASATFSVDGHLGTKIVDRRNFDSHGNFRKQVELNAGSRFSITLDQDGSEPCEISGSPFSVEKLISLQGLKAVFGRPDHFKRKSSGELDRSRKRLGRIG